MLPRDDLYARLELPIDASFEAVEIAWRALLKRHHPDVAGVAADGVAKLINVAHDWLSDPELRARYDQERHPSRRRRPIGTPPPAGPAARRVVRVRPTPPPKPIDPVQAVERHLDRIRRLNDDELDRLALAESPPIAFVATISRFLAPDRLAALESLTSRISGALPARSRWDPATRDASIGYAHELLLGPFLDEHLSEPFRERVRERLARGWESAVDQPRYGPNTKRIVTAIERLSTLTPSDLGRIAAAASAAGREAAGALPWPAGLSAEDDDALRVSSELARRDAAAALPDPVPAIARRSLARAMHGLVLRHGFRPAELSRLVGPWAGVLGADVVDGRATGQTSTARASRAPRR
jgi:curved DNA-binding protein CbpA